MQAYVSMADAELQKRSLSDGDVASVSQNGLVVSLPCKLDDDVPLGCAWVPAGIPETASLGELYGAIEVSSS
jgi:NADH-quinone oxidoreductase subunit G